MKRKNDGEKKKEEKHKEKERKKSEDTLREMRNSVSILKIVVHKKEVAYILVCK